LPAGLLSSEFLRTGLLQASGCLDLLSALLSGAASDMDPRLSIQYAHALVLQRQGCCGLEPFQDL
jgi:hypothetical protein